MGWDERGLDEVWGAKTSCASISVRPSSVSTFSCTAADRNKGILKLCKCFVFHLQQLPSALQHISENRSSPVWKPRAAAPLPAKDQTQHLWKTPNPRSGHAPCNFSMLFSSYSDPPQHVYAEHPTFKLKFNSKSLPPKVYASFSN